MNNQLKFRTWDGKRFHEWGYLTTKDGVVFVSPSAPHFPSQQFTGLQDRQGKDIYEGDIILWSINGLIEEGIVVYTPEFGMYDMKHFEDEYYVCCDWGRGFYEVIGNIFETPELIEKLQ